MRGAHPSVAGPALWAILLSISDRFEKLEVNPLADEGSGDGVEYLCSIGSRASPGGSIDDDDDESVDLTPWYPRDSLGAEAPSPCFAA